MKLKYAFYYLKKYVLRIFINSIRVKFEINDLNKVYLYVNNFCNLNCFSCVSLCDKKVGDNSFREMNMNYNEKNLLKFLDKWDGLETVVLTGGEPTLSYRRLRGLVDILNVHGLRTILFTNGFRLLELDPFIFDYIILDNHGVNHLCVKKGKYYLDRVKYRNYMIKNTMKHYDIRSLNTGGVNCFSCKHFMRLGLWKDIVYPCACFMVVMDGWIGKEKYIENLLRHRGWIVGNVDKDFISKEISNGNMNDIVKLCSENCWHGSVSSNKKWVKIK